MVEIYYYDYEILRAQIKDLCEWCISLCEAENQLRAKFDYFSAFDKIIVYYDYGQVELAQILK